VKTSSNTGAFFALMRAGLWEKELRLSQFHPFDFDQVYQLTQEQSVFGLITAGLEHVIDIQIPKDVTLSFARKTLRMEQRNNAMNHFLGVVVGRMREAGINTILVKGQGVAQSYERPLWRTSGDVDFLLSDTDYRKAYDFLSPYASKIKKEDKEWKHQAMRIGPWEVELHGRLACSFSFKVNKVLNQIKYETFCEGKVRSWFDDNVQIYLLREEYDILYVFVHFVNHFYKGGVGLRQICDWCRLLWKYRDTIDRQILASMIEQMGLMNEWKAFGAFAVEYLGMPVDAMPHYSVNKRLKKKADRICSFILEVGNFGYNRDTSYYAKYPYLIRKAYSFGRRCKDLINHTLIFPLDTLRFFPVIMYNGFRSAMKGDG